MGEGRHRRTAAPPVIAADPEQAARSDPPATVAPVEMPVEMNGHRADVVPAPAVTTYEPVPFEEPASLPELVQSLRLLVARLVRDQLALAKIGLRQRIKRLVLGVAALGVSGVLAVFGFGCLVAAAVQGLNMVVQDWWACLIVSGALGFTALLIVLPGWQGVKGRHPVRVNTLESVKQDVATLRKALRR
ncbi:MAG TPA: phage holin family protein [Jatrophihabitans sp.]|nr:phage holin family protein [Jatrophihabitans sp.]